MSPKFGCGADVVISALSASFWAFPLACWAFDFGFGGFHFGFLSLPLPRVYFTIGLKLGASGFPDSCLERRPSATTRQAPRTRKTARIFFWFFGPSFPFIGLLAFNYFHVGLLAFNFLSFWPFGPSKKSLRQQRRQNCRPAAKQEPYREKYVHHCLASQPFPLLGFAACCCSRPKHCKNKRCSLYSISSSRTERCSLQTFGSCSVRRRPHLEGGGVEVVHLARNHKKLLGKAIQDRIRILTVKKSKLST